MKHLIGLFFLLLPTGSASAVDLEVEWIDQPLLIEQNWNEFLGRFRPAMNDPAHFLTAKRDTVVPIRPQMKIAALAEVPETLLVGFNYGSVVNMAFLRASIFIEKLSGPPFSNSPPFMVDDHPLMRTQALLKLFPMMNGAGHDLRARELLAYWKVLDQQDRRIVRPARASPLAGLYDVEVQARQILEPYLQAHPNTALVIFSIAPFEIGVVSHEISHAQYFNNANYRNAVIKYWENLSEEERTKFRNHLTTSEAGYGNIEDLIINEFQAHLNQINPDMGNILGPLLDPHFTLLRAQIYNTVPGSRFVNFPKANGLYINPLCSRYLIAGLPE